MHTLLDWGLWRPEIQHCLMSSSLFSICQTHGQDLSTISPASIFESMFQSPDHTANQDDSQQTGTSCICTAIKDNFLTALHACTEFSISDWSLMPNITLKKQKELLTSVLKYIGVGMHGVHRPCDPEWEWRWPSTLSCSTAIGALKQSTSSCFQGSLLKLLHNLADKRLIERADEADQAQCRAQCYQLPEFAATFWFHCPGLFLITSLKLGMW